LLLGQQSVLCSTINEQLHLHFVGAKVALTEPKCDRLLRDLLPLLLLLLLFQLLPL